MLANTATLKHAATNERQENSKQMHSMNFYTVTLETWRKLTLQTEIKKVNVNETRDNKNKVELAKTLIITFNHVTGKGSFEAFVLQIKTLIRQWKVSLKQA